MDDPILHFELHCKGCGARMLLPAAKIGWLFADPDAQPNHSHAIAAVCRFCKSVHTYFLERDSPGHAPGNAAIFADPIHETMDGPMLGCGKEGCQALVPLFAQWTPGSTKEERKADVETWRWGHLQCPAGHPIAKPDWELW
ncbi:MAG: hypothetical protein ABSG62_10670 [Terracidiphilus sp.]|jgi:hypothetical protein